MLSQFTIGHIRLAFILMRQDNPSPETLARIEYAEKMIKFEEDAETVRHAEAYSRATGENAETVLQSVADDCNTYGSK